MLSFLRTAARRLETKTFPRLVVFGIASGAFLVAMMMIIVVDAVGRRFLGHPVYGTHETVSWLLSLLFFFSICYTAIKKAHLEIDIIVSRLKPRARGLIITILYLVSTLLSWVLGWQLILYAIAKKASGATGIELTSFPIYPLILAAGFGALVLGVILLIKTISSLGEATGNG